MADRFARSALVGTVLSTAAIFASSACGSDAAQSPRPRPFRIQVVDEETGWGVPLVELRTVNQIRYYTDSNGIIAFDEPGLFGRKVFFTIASHGYDVEKDGSGFRGKAFEITEGGSARIAIRRVNIARRLYRVTGAGIYRDSVLTGDPVPIREPLLNGSVFGQDSVLNAVYRGKIYWFWGDTNRPDYPLGNFHVPGATSELPQQATLDPARGIELTYFVDDRGFARPTAPMPGEGPTWLSGLVVLKDQEGRERMFASYAKARKVLEVYERGLVEFDPGTQQFEKRIQFPSPSSFHGEYPDGHTFLLRDRGVEYVYYANPYPLIRVPADPALLREIRAYEAYSCLKPGTTMAQKQLDSAPGGVLRYGWKATTQYVRQEQQVKLIANRSMRADDGLLNLRDIDSGKAVVAHGGSVYWNAYRRRWVMIAVESYGSSSILGEVWYAEADAPLGPWVYARKIVTHNKYSFYNPKQHPMLDKEGGRVIFFEGTYSTTFAGNPDPTPRYDYNQIMYQLDLSDRRLSLPVAIYDVPTGPTGPGRLLPATALGEAEHEAEPRVAFFAPDRPGIASLPVYETYDPAQGQSLRVGAEVRTGDGTGPHPLFYLLPAAIRDNTAATMPLYEYQADGGRRIYSLEGPTALRRPGGAPRALGRVWRNPMRLRLW
jgi:hypothetical protein